MASFEIRWKRSATQDLRKLNKSIISRIIERVERLLADPRPKGCRKLRETGSHYRVRVGDFRVIYEVLDDRRLIIIHYVRHRKDAYRPH